MEGVKVEFVTVKLLFDFKIFKLIPCESLLYANIE